MIKEGEKYLVSSDSWFMCPDGHQHLAAWGKVKVHNIEDLLGFKPIRPSTNWFLEIGDEKNHVIIAGCQIHHLVCCPNKPEIRQGTYTNTDSTFTHDINKIYIAEDVS